MHRMQLMKQRSETCCSCSLRSCTSDELSPGKLNESVECMDAIARRKPGLCHPCPGLNRLRIVLQAPWLVAQLLLAAMLDGPSIQGRLSYASVDSSWNGATCLVMQLWMHVAVLASQGLNILPGSCACLVSSNSLQDGKDLLVSVVSLWRNI